MTQETRLEKIPEVRRVLTDYLVNVRNTSSKELDERIEDLCNHAKEGKIFPILRQEIVYALWRTCYSSKVMSKMLSVSERTIRRDLEYIKLSLDPLWKIRKKSVDEILKRPSKYFQTYIDEWKMTLFANDS